MIRSLLAATAAATLQVCAGLFAGWLVFFVLADAVDRAPPVGMYYLAWPIAFPILAALPLAVVLVPLLARAGPPYMAALRRARFRWGVLLPVGLVAFAVMVLTCPLETGGTLLDRVLAG
ncbi:MAG: hypothetical protein R3298_08310 [Gammaproteobacteria bacterium]|nr:hypothetical protein [Gammaproteobacteria bacterium]